MDATRGIPFAGIDGERDFAPFCFGGELPGDSFPVDEYRIMVDELALKLGPRAPYSRELRDKLPGNVDLGPEDRGVMLFAASVAVPSSKPYWKDAELNVPKRRVVDGKKETYYEKERSVLPRQNWDCSRCKQIIYGAIHWCLSCAPQYRMCYTCSLMPIQHRHSNFQAFRTDDNPEFCRVVLYRNYSAIVSNPKDEIFLSWLPSVEYAEKFGRTDNATTYYDYKGLEAGITLFRFKPDITIDKGAQENVKLLHAREILFPRDCFQQDSSDNESVVSTSAPLWMSVALPLALCFADPRTVVACMRTCRSLHRIISRSDAFARAKLLHITCSAHAEEMQRYSQGHWKAALSQFQQAFKVLSIALCRSSVDGEEYIVMDLDCVLWKSVQICRRPDSSAAKEARSKFRRENPFYVD